MKFSTGNAIFLSPDLIREAQNIVRTPVTLSPAATTGSVAAAILSETGKIYTGICMDTACSMGGCAEKHAVMSMFAQHEYKIIAVVAVHYNRGVIPPCGQCREFLYQVSNGNKDIRILLGENDEDVVTLGALLPHTWF